MNEITLFINWEQHFITADITEAVNQVSEEDFPFCDWLSETYPDYEEGEETDEMRDEYFDECVEYMEMGCCGWDIKKISTNF